MPRELHAPFVPTDRGASVLTIRSCAQFPKHELQCAGVDNLVNVFCETQFPKHELQCAGVRTLECAGVRTLECAPPPINLLKFMKKFFALSYDLREDKKSTLGRARAPPRRWRAIGRGWSFCSTRATQEPVRRSSQNLVRESLAEPFAQAQRTGWGGSGREGKGNPCLAHLCVHLCRQT